MKSVIAKLAYIAALCLTLTPAMGADFSYKGVKMGDPASIVAEKLPDYAPSRYGSINYRAKTCEEAKKVDCTARNSFAGARVEDGGIFLHEGKVDTLSIRLSVASRASVVQAVKEAYGAPLQEEEPIYQNAYGATYKGYRAAWQSQFSLMTITNKADNDLYVTIESNDRRERRAAMQKPNKQPSEDF